MVDKGFGNLSLEFGMVEWGLVHLVMVGLSMVIGIHM